MPKFNVGDRVIWEGRFNKFKATIEELFFKVAGEQYYLILSDDIRSLEKICVKEKELKRLIKKKVSCKCCKTAHIIIDAAKSEYTSEIEKLKEDVKKRKEEIEILLEKHKEMSKEHFDKGYEEGIKELLADKKISYDRGFKDGYHRAFDTQLFSYTEMYQKVKAESFKKTKQLIIKALKNHIPLISKCQDFYKMKSYFLDLIHEVKDEE